MGVELGVGVGSCTEPAKVLGAEVGDGLGLAVILLLPVLESVEPVLETVAVFCTVVVGAGLEEGDGDGVALSAKAVTGTA